MSVTSVSARRENPGSGDVEHKRYERTITLEDDDSKKKKVAKKPKSTSEETLAAAHDGELSENPSEKLEYGKASFT